MQSDRQARVSERAHQIWVEEGRPDGRHDEHWHRAEREIAEQEQAQEGAVAARARRAKGAAPAANDGAAATGRSGKTKPTTARAKAPADTGNTEASPKSPRRRQAP